METVHVFCATGHFASFDEMRAFVEETYTEDGDGVPSPFAREVGLTGYEPGCIEVIHEEQTRPLGELLRGASYADQWLPLVDETLRADSAICVFAPNVVATPRASSLTYVGAMRYESPR